MQKLTWHEKSHSGLKLAMTIVSAHKFTESTNASLFCGEESLGFHITCTCTCTCMASNALHSNTRST